MAQDFSPVLDNEKTKDEVFHDGNFIMVKLTTEIEGKEFQAVAFAKCKEYTKSAVKAVVRDVERIRDIRKVLRKKVIVPDTTPILNGRAEAFTRIVLEEEHNALMQDVKSNMSLGDSFNIDRGINIARGRAAKRIMRQAGLKIKQARSNSAAYRRTCPAEVEERIEYSAGPASEPSLLRHMEQSERTADVPTEESTRDSSEGSSN